MTQVQYDRRGSKNSRWKGGRRVRNDGYVVVYSPGHPYAYRNFVLEHRLVIEAHLGRHLQPHELVHHKNEIKHDNRLENLVLTDHSEHAYIHLAGRKGKRWKPKFTKEQIEYLYCAQGKTLRQCADYFGISYGAFRRYMVEFCIPIRTSDPWWIRKNKGLLPMEARA